MKYRKPSIFTIAFVLVLVIMPDSWRNWIIKGSMDAYFSIMESRIERKSQKLQETVASLQENMAKVQSWSSSSGTIHQ